MKKIDNLSEIVLNGKGKFRKLRLDALKSIEYILEKIDPENKVKECLIKNGNKLKILFEDIDLKNFNRNFLISFGKAAIKMTKGVLSKLDIYKGIVVSNIDYSNFPRNIEYIKGDHPYPSENSIYAGKKLIKFSKEIQENDLVLIMISGGGSSLVEHSLISLNDLIELTKLMLKTGLSIEEINTIRKHISEIKGGKLLKYLKGKVYSLIISDVIGDDLSVIASGPTYFDNSTFLDALNILKKYDLINKVPVSVVEIINKGIRNEIEETLKEKDFPKERVKNFIISSNYEACKNLIEFFYSKGYSTLYLGSRIQGDIKEVSKVIGGIILDIYENKINIKKPAALIFGGETTVFVKGFGKGGRNQELSLIISKYIKNKDILFLSFGTDGIDGVTDAAGAIVDGDTLNRGELLNLDYNKFLENNDSYNFFKNLNDLIITGSTGNNVMDIGIALIL
ncbi:MAG: glycerate kinase [Caldisericia bacterium]|nr:glycerate kinase [Caldisericia bacterium]